MSNLKTRLQRLERKSTDSGLVIILLNSLECEDGSIGRSDRAFSRIINGIKIIYADESQDYRHLL